MVSFGKTGTISSHMVLRAVADRPSGCRRSLLARTRIRYRPVDKKSEINGQQVHQSIGSELELGSAMRLPTILEVSGV